MSLREHYLPKAKDVYFGKILVGNSVSGPQDGSVSKGSIPNIIGAPFLTVENRTALPMSIGVAQFGSSQPGASFTLPPLTVGTLPIDPQSDVVWSVPTDQILIGNTKATYWNRSVPYVLHRVGPFTRESIYPTQSRLLVSNQNFFVQAAVQLDYYVVPQAQNGVNVKANSQFIVQRVSPDVAILAITVQILGFGATPGLPELLSITPNYDFNVATLNWSSAIGANIELFPAGAGIGATTQVDLGGAVDIQFNLTQSVSPSEQIRIGAVFQLGNPAL